MDCLVFCHFQLIKIGSRYSSNEDHGKFLCVVSGEAKHVNNEKASIETKVTSQFVLISKNSISGSSSTLFKNVNDSSCTKFCELRDSRRNNEILSKCVLCHGNGQEI